MADRNKFEEMLERLINEDKEGAEELFHEIVVEKSREIYENILEDDLEIDEADEDEDEDIDEAMDDDEDEDEVEESKDEDEDDKLWEKDRAGRQHPKYRPGSANHLTGGKEVYQNEEKVEYGSGRTTNEIERQESPAAPMALERRAQEVQADHVEEDVH